jgi:hypothetical protein
MEEFTASQQELSRECFGDILPEMGHKVLSEICILHDSIEVCF